MASAKKFGIILLSLMIIGAAAATTACQKKAPEKAAEAQVQKPTNEFEGTVKAAFGKYMYVSAAQGFDIVAQGFDTASVAGKDVLVKGEMLPDKPSIFRADSIDLKEAGGYRNVFTRNQELTLSEFIDVNAREAYPVLTITSALKPEEWENKGKVKIFGKLQETTVKEGGAEKPITYIVISDDKGKEIGKIIVDSISDYAKYYLQKLRLFNNFYFYLNVKESVDKKIRPRTKELFHADVTFAGLF